MADILETNFLITFSRPTHFYFGPLRYLDTGLERISASSGGAGLQAAKLGQMLIRNIELVARSPLKFLRQKL
ncbi:MAG TPA: hypothetical protein VJQ56_09600 [Blastocatellia bacterium]|nr:hypothetical protein [Blastocatellia bacterium]